jgi:hypothetical protein
LIGGHTVLVKVCKEVAETRNISQRDSPRAILVVSNVVLKLLNDARDVSGLLFEEVYLLLLIFITVDPQANKREGLALDLLFILLLYHLLNVLLLFLLIEGLVVPNVGNHALW